MSSPTSPPHVVVIGLDDTRHDNLFGVLKSAVSAGQYPPNRSGAQLIMFNFWTRIFPNAMKFGAHGTTFGPCWTSRTEWFMGLTWMNHKFGNNSTTLFQTTYVQGEKRAGPRPQPEWIGPVNSSLAARAGFPSTRVSHATQVAMNVLRPDPADPVGIPHDPTDDLQLTSGSVFQEAARRAMVMFGGKYNNPYRKTDLIPAGITRWRGQFLSSDGVGQYQGDFVEYDGSNPFDGIGVSPPASTTYNYQRGTCSIGAYTTVLGVGRLKVSMSTNAHKYVSGDVGTFCVQITGSTVAAYNGLWKLVAIDNSTQCWFEFDGGNLGSPTGAQLWNRTELPLMKLAEWTAEFIDEVQAAGKPCLIWLNPHQTHSTAAEDPSGESTSTFEKCYTEAIDLTQATYFDGQPSTVSPASTFPPSVATQQVWQYVMQMMATVDDWLGMILDKLDAVWPGNYYLIFTSDQGIQNAEQAVWGDGSVKTAVWEGSRRSFCFIMGPGIAHGEFDRPTMHADLPATVLDMLGDTTNHMHLRDGRSLLRVTNPADPAYNRVIPDYGQWKTVAAGGEGYLRHDGKKFMRAPGTTTGGKLYDWRLPSQGGDYESTEVDAAAAGEAIADNALMTLLNAGRYNLSTESNPFHDGTLSQ